MLDRYYQASRAYRPDYVVRLNGDCPLADPEVIDRVVRHCVDGDYDYVSSGVEPSFPDGLDAEAFWTSCLERAWREATLLSEREHVTTFFYRGGRDFRVGHVRSEVDLSRLRWTVDEPRDFEFVTRVYEELYPRDPAFGTQAILALLDRKPELSALNSSIVRNEGFQKSLPEDAAWLGKGKKK